jgi:solute carrier family 35, member F1/2
MVSTRLAELGASVPFTQSASNYTLLFLVFGGPVRVFQWKWEQKAWKYGLLAGFDVAATWCVVKAFSLTSITSVTLLDSWTIPCVIILTAVFLKQRYAPCVVLDQKRTTRFMNSLQCEQAELALVAITS